MKTFVQRTGLYLWAAFLLTLVWALIAALLLVRVTRDPEQWPIAFLIACLAAILLVTMATRGG